MTTAETQLVGERKAAEYVAEKLSEVGYDTTCADAGEFDRLLAEVENL